MHSYPVSATADVPPPAYTRDSEAVFAAVLTPHRSLGPTGFLVLMSVFGGVSFITGLVFLLMGAWPVLGFCGLDVLILYLAFRLNYRAARACEIVEVTPGELRLIRIDAGGRVERHAFNPFFVRVELEDRPSRPPVLKLTSRGRGLIFAKCLNEDEKRAFAEALKGGLAAAKGPRI